MALSILLLVLSGPLVTPVSPADFVPLTTSSLTFFVDPTGNDGNSCLSSGTGACATIQGALNKAPKLLRHLVTISIAAGSYGGFYVSGFSADNEVQQTTGGLLIDGALATSTLATGSATGTAAGSGQSAGSGSTFGTLCDSGATWTASDLVGRFITTVSPTNTTFPITANTSTCVTIAGTWSLPVAGSTTYTIQDPSVIVTSPVSNPATPLTAASANRAGIYYSNNVMAWSNNNPIIVTRNIRVANTTGIDGVEVADNGWYGFRTMQIRPTNGAAFGLGVFTSSARPTIDIRLSEVALISTGNGIATGGATFQARNVLLRNGSTSHQAGIITDAESRVLNITATEIDGFRDGVEFYGGTHGVAPGAFSAFQNGRITCNNVTDSTGIAVGEDERDVTGTGIPLTAVATSITNAYVNCAYNLTVSGTSQADVTSMSGDAGVSGFTVHYGGLILFVAGSTTMPSGTSEISLDTGGFTANFADVTAGTCISTGQQGSRVCAR